MIYEKRSVMSGKLNRMDLPVTPEEIAAWENGGGLIQDVFPQLTADEREFLMTGATPEEWDEAFKEDEDAS